MRTDDLIAQLSTGLEPVKTGAVTRILLISAGVGIVASIALMLGHLGLRYDFDTAISSFGLWMKVTYTFAIAGFGLWLVERAGRPGADMTRPMTMLALPLLAIALLAALQLSAPGVDMNRMVMGYSSDVCATNILIVATPILLAVFWALRQLAPTRLTLAGAGAGLFAGAAGATVYAFHCMEATAPFIAIWYTLGIALTTALGALLGRFLLRW
jgi:hypothetical protein